MHNNPDFIVRMLRKIVLCCSSLPRINAAIRKTNQPIRFSASIVRSIAQVSEYTGSKIKKKERWKSRNTHALI
jgi:hypothetical protein